MNDTLSVGELARIAAEVLGDSHFPALILDVPSERIVAASPTAALLIDPSGGMIVGHLLEDFTADSPAHGFEVFAGGRLNGFETFRVLRRDRGKNVKVRMWIRSLPGRSKSDFVVVIFDEEGGPSIEPAGGDWRGAPAAVGVADENLLIERISSDAQELFKVPISKLLGTSLLGLVAPDDVPTCLDALCEVSTSQTGITLQVGVRTGEQRSALHCEMVVLPLLPSSSCAFIFLPIPVGRHVDPVKDTLSAILLRLSRGADMAQLVRGVFSEMIDFNTPSRRELTAREYEIVTLLLEGDRVPAIAARLFLSQSTVRNHLAAVFAKLGVSSQQALLDSFRSK